jgi:hypothetical protein
MEAYTSRKAADNEVLRIIPHERLFPSLLIAAQGIFRWLGCQLQYLSVQPTVKLALRALDMLPESIRHLHCSLLRVPGNLRALVKEALTWLASAH